MALIAYFYGLSLLFPHLKTTVHISSFIILLSLFAITTSAQPKISLNLNDSSKHENMVLVREVLIEGNKKTKNYIIERELAIRAGDSIKIGELAGKIDFSKRQLINTSLFLSVNITVSEPSPGLATVMVSVKERWYIFPVPYFRLVDRNFNTWWVDYDHDLDRVNYGLKFSHNNVSGRNDRLRFWLINGYNRQVQIGYSMPYIDNNLRFGAAAGINYSRAREVQYLTRNNKQVFFPDSSERRIYGYTFVRELFRFDASFVYRPGLRTRHYARIGFVSDHISDSAVAKNPEYFGNHRSKVHYAEVAYTYQFTNVDYIYYPLTGFMCDASFTARDPGGFVQMYQLDGNFLQAYKLAKHTFINLAGSGTLKLPFDQPYYNRKLIGYGSNYIRGLEYYVIDGVASANFKGTLKQQVLDFKLKTPLKKSKNHAFVPIKLFIKAYGDLGYAYSKPEQASMLNNKLLYSGGIGVDVVSFYDLVFRVEYSFNQLNQSGVFLHFRLD